MTILLPAEQAAMDAVAQNHQRYLQQLLVQQFSKPSVMDISDTRLQAWLDEMTNVRRICAHWLDDMGTRPDISSHLGHGVVGVFARDGLSWLSQLSNKAFKWLPDGVYRRIWGDKTPLESGTAVAADVFSLALGPMATRLIHDSFCRSYHGRPDQAEQAFKAAINDQGDLTQLIRSECEQLSVKLVQLFCFREMLLGYQADKRLPRFDARAEFIRRAGINEKDQQAIDAAIEVYFLKALNQIFLNGFTRLYEAHDQEILDEQNSVILHWLNQYFDSADQRQAFTQQMQLEFMQMTRDFILTKINERGWVAKKSWLLALGIGLLASTLVAGSMALILGGSAFIPIVAFSLLTFVLAGLATWLMIRYVPRFQFSRQKQNREQLGTAVSMIHDELLRLDGLIGQQIKHQNNLVQRVSRFERFSDCHWLCLSPKQMAVGTPLGWLREYAAHYRHSKERAIDLAGVYQSLVVKSRQQIQWLLEQLSAGKTSRLRGWIEATRAYLSDDTHQADIDDFELRQKIREQVLTLAAALPVPVAELNAFYCQDIAQGGLGGLPAQLAQAQRLMRDEYLARITASLDKQIKLNAPSGFIVGDAHTRGLLGLSFFDAPALNSANIDQYLQHTRAFMMRLYQPIQPGLGASAMQQPMIERDELLLYRMTLLVQFAELCHGANAHPEREVVLKIKQFTRDYLQVEPDVLFDDLINMNLLESYQPEVADSKAAYLRQMMQLTLAYSQKSMMPKHVLNSLIQQSKMPRHCLLLDGQNLGLTPYADERFLDTLKSYITDTSWLLNQQKSSMMQASGVDACYRFEVSCYVYQMMANIIAEFAHQCGDCQDTVLLLQRCLITLIDFMNHQGERPIAGSKLGDFFKSAARFCNQESVNKTCLDDLLARSLLVKKDHCMTHDIDISRYQITTFKKQSAARQEATALITSSSCVV